MLNKALIKKSLPEWLLSFYHFIWAVVASLAYNFPSSQLIVIGVTGTKGKSTVAAMICHALNNLGQSCGLISTATIKIGEYQWLNNLKMTMPGRFILQKYLRQMVRVGCRYAVVETSSEGIKQWRHIGINYDVAIFTNLTPEHIETHGSFAKYQQAKQKLWKKLQSHHKKFLSKGVNKKIPKVSIINLDDPAYANFLVYPADVKYGYTMADKILGPSVNMIKLEAVKLDLKKIEFLIKQTKFTLPVGGKFNVENAAATICCLLSQGFSLVQAAEALKDFIGAPGRLEFVEAGQNFSVIVDYAHTPESLEAVYQTLKKDLTAEGKLIAVLGSCGGGRDRNKRPVLGKLAASYADIAIVTNEDPYDEDPQVIMKAVAEGAEIGGKKKNENLFIISDRQQAIAYALSLAQSQDIVVITGKGSEQWLVTGQGKIPWDDRIIVKQEIKKLLKY